MLVLSRKKNESIIINENVVITVVDVRGDKVRIGIEAPRDVTVHRQEVLESILNEKLKFSSPRSEESSDVTVQ
jgi:carbon storage regulator